MKKLICICVILAAQQSIFANSTQELGKIATGEEIVKNTEDILLQNPGEIILKSKEGGTAINEGTITSSNYNEGIRVEDGGKGINSGSIKLLPIPGLGIVGGTGIFVTGKDSVGINDVNGTIDLSQGGTGIRVGETGKGINEGKITVGEMGEGMISYSEIESIEKPLLINKKNGIINVNSNAANAIFLEKNSEGINEGTINIINGTYAINSNWNSKGINKGIIKVTGKKISGGLLATENSDVINEKEGIIIVEGEGKGICAGIYGKETINKGTIRVTKGFGMYQEWDSNGGVNEGLIEVNNGTGMFMENYSLKGVNKKEGIISVKNNGYGMYVKNSHGSYLLNEGEINVDDSIGMFIENTTNCKNTGIINVTSGKGIKAINTNFYNSGIINADGKIAIEMDDSNSILELGAGTFLRGLTDGLKGEDTLVLSDNGTVDVGDNSVHNFEKLVVTGDIIAKGTYNLEVSNGSDYESSASGGYMSYKINDASGVPGDLTVDGTINIGVDYDGIDKAGTDKTGKIIANTISKTSNGHIVLVNKGTTTSNIIDEAKKSDANIDEFRIKGLATVSGAQVVDPTLFETKDLFDVSGNWRTMTVGDRVGLNGSILLDQKYSGSIPMIDLVPATKIIPMTDLVPVTKVTPMIDLVPSTKVTSKILIPRNRVDLDSMETLNKIKNDLVLSNNLDLSIGEDAFTADYLGTKGKSRFMGSKSYNYDYDINTDGVAFTYMYKANKKLSLGTAVSYEKNEVKYNGVRIENISVVAPSQNHTEIIDSYNTEIFTKYENNNLNVVLDLGYGLSNHKAKTNFVSGIKDGKYDSHILKAGIEGSYTFDLENDLTDETKLVPTIGLEYVNVFEESYRYKDSVKLESANGDGYVGTIGLQLKNRKAKISWNYGVTYKYNSEDTFHNKRKVSGYDLEVEKLDYSRKTLSFNFDTEYSVTEDFSLRAGYEYEKNDNYRNNNINLGFTYKF
ncbi:MAG: autotransporter outer membrane beta-barrel domain-containing protein [Fusobacterium sp. JB019]|nr:autotransporter outer membrane beta-barrel domain-containing protein [Fusobacterium sp. JB019]